MTEVRCGFESVTAVTFDEVDEGALEPGETGYIGHCQCGWSSRVRYSRTSAKSAVAGHALHLSPHAINLGRAAASSAVVAGPASARSVDHTTALDGTASSDDVDNHAPGLSPLAVPISSEATR